MRFSVANSVYFTFVGFLLACATALLATAWRSGIIDARVQAKERLAGGVERHAIGAGTGALDAEWRPLEVTARVPVTPATSFDLYPVPHPDAPLPNVSAKSSDLVQNLFYALKYYSTPPEQFVGQLFVAQYDRESGRGMLLEEYAEEPIIDHLAYLAALEIHHQFYPEIALFDAERLRMREVVHGLDRLLPTPEMDAASPRARSSQPYFLARRLAELTGDAWFDEFALKYSQGMVRQLEGYSALVDQRLPNTVYASHFALPAVGVDLAQREGNPALRRIADSLMNYLIERLYDPKTNTILNDYGSQLGSNADTRTAEDQFTAIEGLWEYYRLTGDQECYDLAVKLSYSYTYDTTTPSVFLDPYADIYKLYDASSERGTLPTDGATESVTPMLNLASLFAASQLNGATRYESYDQDFATLLESFEQKFYDAIFNGLYWEYDPASREQRYEPVAIEGQYFLNTRLAIRYAYLRLADRDARERGYWIPQPTAAPAPET